MKSNIQRSLTYVSDAYLFQLSCLFYKVFNEKEDESFQINLNLLQVQIEEVLESPLCSCILSKCFRLNNSNSTEFKIEISSDFISSVSKKLGFTALHLIIFSSSFLDESDSLYFQAKESIKKSPSLLENLEISSNSIPVGIIYNFLRSLSILPLTHEQRTNVLSILQKELPLKTCPSYLCPFLYKVSDDYIYTCLLTNNSIVSTSLDKKEIINFSELFKELGYNVSANENSLRLIFSQFPSGLITASTISKLFGMFLRTHSNLTNNAFHCLKWCIATEKKDHLESWNIEIVIKVIKEMNPNLCWEDVIRNLDHSEFIVPDEDSLLVLTRIFKEIQIQKEIGPHLFNTVWTNPAGQWSLLKQVIISSNEFNWIFNSLSRFIQDGEISLFENTHIKLWASLDFVETLILLAKKHNPQDITRTCLEFCKCPDILILSLIFSNVSYSSFQQEIIVCLLNTVFQNYPTTSKFIYKIWKLKPMFVLQCLTNWQQKPNSMTKVKGIAKHLNLLVQMKEQNVSDSPVDFQMLEFHKKLLQNFIVSSDSSTSHVTIIVNDVSIDFPPFPVEIEDDATNYFQKMYDGVLSINCMIQLLKTFKESFDIKKNNLCRCMIRDLFEEYKFYENYPLKELTMTSILFGQLIYQKLLFNPLELLFSLQCIVVALQKKFNSPMFVFGTKALEQFQNALNSRIDDIPVKFIQSLLEIKDFVASCPEAVELCTKFLIKHSLHQSERTISGKEESFHSSFGRINDINTLLSTNISLENPNRKIKDHIHFMFDNLSSETISKTCSILKLAIKPEHYPWLVNYLVTRKVSVEPNLHSLFIELIDQLNIIDISQLILTSTYESINALLNSTKILTSSSERLLLKHLGTWLGLITLAKNKCIHYHNLALKELVVTGYKEDCLIYILPFVSKVLEGGKKGIVFVPPNPWLMAILKVLKEIHSMQETKLNLKFEIEMLYKIMKLDITKVIESNVLKELKRETQLKMQEIKSPNYKKISNEENTYEEPNYLLNMQCKLFQQSPQGAKRCIHIAVQRAFKEISPVLDRSVYYCAMVTKELLLKDFSIEKEKENIINLSHIIVQSLTVNLVVVTCKDPFRMALTSHLRNAFLALVSRLPLDQQNIIALNAVQIVLKENIESLIAMIETTATEKAIGLINELFSSVFISKRNLFDSGSFKTYYNEEIYQKKLSLNLPEVLFSPTNQVSPLQLQIYNDGFLGLAPLFFQKTKCKSNTSTSSIVEHNPLHKYHSANTQNNSQTISSTSFQSNSTDSQQNGLQSSFVLEKLTQLIKDVYKIIQTSHLMGSSSILEILSFTNLASLLRQMALLILQCPQKIDVCVQFTKKIIQILFEMDSNETLLLKSFVLVLQTLSELTKASIKETTNYVRKIHLIENNLNSKRVFVMIELIHHRLVPSIEVDSLFHQLINEAKKSNNFQVYSYCFNVVFQSVAVPSLTSSGLLLPPVSFPKTCEILLQSSSLSLDHQQFLLSKLSKWNLRLEKDVVIPIHLKESILLLFDECIRLSYHQQPILTDKHYAMFISKLCQQGILKSEEVQIVFFRVCIKAAIKSYNIKVPLNIENEFCPNSRPIESLSRLFSVLIKMPGDSKSRNVGFTDSNNKLSLTVRILEIISEVLLKDYYHQFNESKDDNSQFNQRSYHKLFDCLFKDLMSSNPLLDYFHLKVLSVFGTIFHKLRPSSYPLFSFSWLRLISNKFFLPELLKTQKCWPIVEQLLHDAFQFLTPMINVIMNDSVLVFYNTLMQLLLYLFNDFPEFLCDYHFSLCDSIPSTCIQMRNIVLSAFPSTIRLPNPFTPNLKVDKLNDISLCPQILSKYELNLSTNRLKKDLSDFFNTKNENFLIDLPKMFVDNSHYNVSLIREFTFFVGIKAIDQISPNFQNFSLINSPAIEIYKRLLSFFCSEGRYHLINSIADQLRYPNKHTYYFSCVLLFLFVDSNNEIKEQITRVLVERLIVSKPHPWGIIITFIELIKNHRYQFWTHSFVLTNQRIKSLFDSVQKSIRQSCSLTQQLQQSEPNLVENV